MMMNKTPLSAPAFALKLLSFRNHSRKELERKLLRKGYPPESIEPVLNKLTAQGALDDRVFSMELIRSRSRRKPSGKLVMSAELRKRGVHDTVIEELLNEYESAELCRKAAEKKIASLAGATEQERRKKLALFLRNRGFGWQEIEEVLKGFFEQSQHDDDPC
ncbi:MAG: recombination regulator RecX [Chlorobium sp.]